VPLEAKRADVDEVLARAVEKALKADPAERFADGAALLAGLKGVGRVAGPKEIGAFVESVAPREEDARKTLDESETETNATLTERDDGSLK
jgi:hypothetical protein